MRLGIDMELTAKRVSKSIVESGLTDKELSSIMGLSVQSVNKWRHGHNIPDLENLYILSRILCVKVDDLIVPREQNVVAVKRYYHQVYDRLRAYYMRYRKIRRGELYGL